MMQHHLDNRDFLDMVKNQIDAQLQRLYPLVGADDVAAAKCAYCRGIPQEDWLPFWVYDEYDLCTCWVCPECKEQRPGDDRVLEGMKCGQCNYEYNGHGY